MSAPWRNSVFTGDVRDWAAALPDRALHTIVTSPPYFNLRSYLDTDHPSKSHELGSEATPAAYVESLVGVFRRLWPKLRDDGCLFINLGDSFGPGKQLQGIPWRVAFGLQADGWVLRSDIIWAKPNPMPESVTDRPTRAHEYLFLLTKKATYYYDAEAVKEPSGPFKPAGPNSRADNDRDPTHGTRKQDAVGKRTYTGFNDRWRDRPVEGRNRRSVWTVATAPTPMQHYATFPPELIRPCIRAGCPVGGVVGDPFLGSGTVAQVATEEGRDWAGSDLDPRTVDWTAERLHGRQRRLVL